MNNPPHNHPWRLIILLLLGLGLISISMPIIASTSPQRIEAGQVTPLGIFDVATAFLAAASAIAIHTKGRGMVDDAIYRTSYNLVAYTLVAILLTAVLFLDRIFWWDVLAIGLAWRFYLFVMTLPAAIGLWNERS